MERIQHRYIRATAFAGVLLLSCVLGACGGGPRESTRYPAGSIAAIMAADERLDTLMRITEHDMPPVALDSITSLDLDITILAPTDDAFAALPPGTLEVLLDDDNVRGLQLVFDHHVIGRGYSLGELRSKAQSADGEVEGSDLVSLGIGDARQCVLDAADRAVQFAGRWLPRLSSRVLLVRLDPRTTSTVSTTDPPQGQSDL